MGLDWQTEIVEDHSRGITDLITSSTSAFQEESDNLMINPKINTLSTRPGYTGALGTVPYKIRQLFKLEDYVIAYAYDGESLADLQINGLMYYKKEIDTAGVWSQVVTPKSRSGAVTFNISNSDGKGFNLYIPNPFQMDNFIVKSGTSGSSPVVTYDQILKAIIMTVDTAKITADKRYDQGGGTYLKWSYFLSAFAITGSSTTLFSGTLGTEEVKFTGQLNIQTAPVAGSYYNSGARSTGAGTVLPIFNEAGHIQGSEWSSHLYMAEEPFNKAFIPNPNDKYATDPDTYPPDNNRLPLRKMAPIASQPGSAVSGYELTCVNAQLPKTFIGIDTSFTTSSIYDNNVANYQYQMLDCALTYSGTKHSTDPLAFFRIFAERSWGRAGTTTDMTNQSYFFIRAVAQKDVDGLDNVFTLVDYNDRANANYTGYNIQWGQLYLVWHSLSNTKTTATYTEAMSLIADAFTRYNKSARAAYMPFGSYISPSPKAFVADTVSLTTGQQASTQWYASLPDDVPGNYQYGYAFFLRDAYNAQFEGAPRQFSFDGPTSFLQVSTLSKIGSSSIFAYYTAAKTTYATFSPAPFIWGGIAIRMRRETDLYFQSNISAIFARTVAQGDTYYIDQTVETWLRTENTVPPTSTIMPNSLIVANWQNTTGYIVPGQSTTSDNDLIFNEEAYFNNGVLSYDSLPQGPYYFTINNQVGYYANIVNNIQRVYQSVPSIPHASPATVFVDFNDEITAINGYLDKPIVWTQNETWRMEGIIASDGSGRIIQRTVSDEYGCISNQSVVITNVGIFFWSNSGIIYTNGLECVRVTEHLIGRYDRWLSAMRTTDAEIGPRQLRGSFDELNRWVVWSCWDAAHKPFQIVLSLAQGINPTMPIRTFSGVRLWDWDGSPGVNATPVDLFQTHATLYSNDSRKFYRSQDHAVLVASNEANDDAGMPIITYLKSVAYSYGLPWARKFTTRMMLNFRDMNKAGVSCTPLGWNDLQEEPDPCGNCLNYQHMVWAGNYATPSDLDLEHFFRQADVQWKTEHIVSYKRSFPGRRVRNVYKQVGFKSLLYKYGPTLDSESEDIAMIEVTLVQTPDLPWVKIRIKVKDITADSNPFPGLDILAGRSYISWEEDQNPLQIEKYFEESITDPQDPNFGDWYIMYVVYNRDIPTNISTYTYFWPTVKFYRYFTDQHIDLIGYTLTYRLIGDKTHGMKKGILLGGDPNV